jgi:hypothetical protein
MVAWDCTQVSPFVVCGGQSDTGTGFYPSSLVIPVGVIHCCPIYAYILCGDGLWASLVAAVTLRY